MYFKNNLEAFTDSQNMLCTWFGLHIIYSSDQRWAIATTVYRISHICMFFQDIEKYRNRIFVAIFFLSNFNFFWPVWTLSEIYDIFWQVTHVWHVFLTVKLWSWSILLLLQNIATEPHTASLVFTVWLSQKHFFAIISQPHHNKKMGLLKDGWDDYEYGWICF